MTIRSWWSIPSVVVPPQMKLPTVGALGDPLSKVIGPPSNGTGYGGGIGSGSGGGVGSGTGPGVGPGHGGGYGGGAYRVGGGVSAPKVLYEPDPEYSEEARKAKYQGTVVLWLVVARTAIRNRFACSARWAWDWMRRPSRRFGSGASTARQDGQAVPVMINVEVNFRLY